MISTQFSIHTGVFNEFLGGFVVFWDYDFHLLFHTTEISTNSLGNFMEYWNFDFHIVYTTELLTDSLGGFVMFWNHDFHTVFHTAELSTDSLGDFVVFLALWFPHSFPHSGAFNQFPGGFCGVFEFRLPPCTFDHGEIDSGHQDDWYAPNKKFP